ncbi:MAG: tetratricopeptide repeat protein [Nitrospirota bacterium]|nr:tetratricopeptide repeat protein [Nitrospirota bacterium]
MVYKVYSFLGYYGLIILKTLVYLATVSLISFYFLKDSKNKSTLFIMTVVLFYFLVLIPRYLLVRPHIFSYLFIIAFLYILEFKPKKAIYLPLLAVLWVNLHGIEYPVMIMICLAYIIESYIKRIKNKRHFTRDELVYIIPIVISMGAIFLTPHGIKLIEMPFISTTYASQYINELRPLSLDTLLTLRGTVISPNYVTIFSLLLLGSTLAALKSILTKQIRISHLLLFAGGIILLTKGIRFIDESALLAIPVLAANAPVPATGYHKKTFSPVSIFLVAVLIIMPVMFLKNIFPNQAKYPVSARGLPAGVATFLKRLDVGGSVLNYPNNGGYLQWMLYPKYKIFMDMEVPLLFTDEDFYIATNAFANVEVLRKVISKYNPPFIVVPNRNTIFREIIKKFPDYTMVFFDDTEVLYVDKKTYPEIARKFELRKIDPYTIIGQDISRLNKEDKDSIMEELFKLTEIYPDSNIINQVIAMMYNMEGDYLKAIPYADLIIKNIPELPKGYRLKGDSMMGLKRFDKAVSFYEKALDRSNEGERTGIYRKLWVCYTNLKQYKKAYNVLSKATRIFSIATPFTDLYNLGLSALRVGKTTEALMLFKFALLKVPQDDVEWQVKIKEQLSRFIIEGEKLSKDPLLE